MLISGFANKPAFSGQMRFGASESLSFKVVNTDRNGGTTPLIPVQPRWEPSAQSPFDRSLTDRFLTTGELGMLLHRVVRDNPALNVAVTYDPNPFEMVLSRQGHNVACVVVDDEDNKRPFQVTLRLSSSDSPQVENARAFLQARLDTKSGQA